MELLSFKWTSAYIRSPPGRGLICSWLSSALYEHASNIHYRPCLRHCPISLSAKELEVKPQTISADLATKVWEKLYAFCPAYQLWAVIHSASLRYLYPWQRGFLSTPCIKGHISVPQAKQNVVIPTWYRGVIATYRSNNFKMALKYSNKC